MMRKLEELWFRFFSENTANTKDWWVRYLVWGILATPAIIGVIVNEVKGNNAGLPWIYVFAGMLLVFAIVWIIVYYYHNWRIKHGM